MDKFEIFLVIATLYVSFIVSLPSLFNYFG
jgi:hypothetical protein